LPRIFTENTDDLVRFSGYFPNEQLFVVSHALADIMNYLATRKIPPYWCKQEKDRLFSQVRH